MADEPEYDMEFHRWGPNAMEMPPSPPATPPPEDEAIDFEREPSPFSEATSMTSVDSTDSVGYYREEAGRMFAALPDVPVVMPVDHAEIRRVSGQYELIKLVTGNNYFHEVDDLLRSPGGDTKRVLDIVSNSPWIDEMALEYPHVKFTGANFVPTRHPYRENVQFEVYNLVEGLHGKNGTYDIIHADATFKMTRDFKFWLKEMRRLLKPGGMLLLCDMEMAAWMADGSDPVLHIPTICKYTDCVDSQLRAQGIDLVSMPCVGGWLRELGGFDVVEDTVTSVPVGPWDTDELQQEIGAMARDNIMGALYSCHPLMARLGRSQAEIDELITEARRELYEKNLQLFERVFYVYARKSFIVVDEEEQEQASTTPPAPSISLPAPPSNNG
ncbi:hypothetical protein SCHPADRAFT_836007 [Schizopora paradoxa]|uniref:Methyltransferase type 11 domain-containing protein n=1 Tax=Schizopora paradoxa TaxID=27342 RepID=A0A0H2R7X5_9AGAM|nr:hypothetical protein SCHPADRAFT_836007 [Schizopora paradoxa]